MKHSFPMSKFLLLLIISALSCGKARGIETYDWPYNDSYSTYNSIVVYFYDTEFRNGGITSHLWLRETDDEGVVTDTPYADWDNRPTVTMTGYQYMDDEGVNHPLYRLSITTWRIQEGTTSRLATPTNLLFVAGSGDQSADYEYTFGNVYSFGHDKDFQGEALDLSRVSEITEGKYTVYLACRSEYQGSNSSDYNWYYHTDTTGQRVFPKVHVWGPDGDLTPYAQNESMTESPDPNLRYKVVNYGLGYSSFYEYSFYYFGETPTGILFRLTYTRNSSYYDYETGEWIDKISNLNYQTGDLRFENGAVYYYDGQGVVTEPVSDPEFTDRQPPYIRTIYFADTDSWVYDNESTSYPYLYAYMEFLVNGSKNTSYFQCTPDTSYKKYIKINDKWCRVYKLTLQCDYYTELIKTVAMRHSNDTRRSTIPFELTDDALYYYAGNGIPTPVLTDFEDQLVDEIPVQEPRPVTIYVNLGANQLMEEDLWEPPYCHPYKRAPGGDIHGDYSYTQMIPNAVSAESERTEEAKAQLEREKMTMIAPGFYSYTIEDANQIDDVVLYYYAEDKAVVRYEYKDILDENGEYVLDQWGNRMQETIPIYTTFPGVFVLSASRSPHFDPTELTKYVFDIGVDCIHQSYLTYDQLQAINAVALDKQPYLYLSGNETVDIDNSGDDPIRAKAIANDHGCFFTDFEVTEDSPAVYKFSTIDVAGTYDALGRDRECYDYQRGWATYNQGIIGCHIDPTRSDYEEWYATHIVKPEGAPSRMVTININQCMDYNNYCQYPWRVEYDPTGATGVKYPGHYWFVVDFNEDDQTVVLLDFDPHPHVTSVPKDVRQIAIPSTEVAEILHNNVYAEACEHNGKILFENVNVASGEIDITGTGNQAILDAGFDVIYTIYTENGQILYEGKPEVIMSDYMNLSESTGLGVQGRFHYQYFDEELNTDVHKYFRTRYDDGTVDLNFLTLAAPNVTQDKKQLLLYMSNGGTDITVGGAVNFTYTLDNPDGYVYHPDYNVTSMSIDGEDLENVSAPLIDKDHWINNNMNKWGNWLGSDHDTPWQPYSEESGFAPENHWANYIINSPTGNMPILFDRLKITDDMNLRSSHVNGTIDIKARYPFLMHRGGKLIEAEPMKVRAKAAAEGETVPDDIENYSMFTLTTVTPQKVDFDDNVVTGVDNVAVDAPDNDSEPVYYNLAGQRIASGRLTPGVYIESRGTAVRKIIVQ